MWNERLQCYVFKSLAALRRFEREHGIRLRVTGIGAVDHIYAVEVTHV